MGKSKLDPLEQELRAMQRHNRFVSAFTTAGVALLTVGLRNIWMRYFQGDPLGFIGFCAVSAFGLYAIYLSVIWFSQRSGRR